MRFEYSLDMQDFLTFQLFTASRSPLVMKKRRRNRIVIPVVYLFLALVLVAIGSFISAIVFTLIGLAWFLFYPVYERRLYPPRYKKYLAENLANRFGKPVLLEFSQDLVFTRDFMGEEKINLSQAEELAEIGDYYFLKFNSGASLIIPKRAVSNQEASRFFSELVARLNIKHTVDLEWVWR